MPQVVIGAGLVAGSAAAASVPIFGAGGIFAFGGLLGSAAQIGLGLIINGVGKELFSPGQLDSARTVSIRAPVAPREIVYGRSRKGGIITFIHLTGDNNQFLHLVIALAGHSINKIGAVYFDGEEAIDENGTGIGRYAESTFVEKRLGTDDQSAFSQLQIDAPDKWTPNHRLRGIACVHLRLEYSQNAFPRGIPDISFDIEGKNTIYDPRSMTSGYSENSALCVADYLADSMFGLGITIGAEDGVNTAALVEAANVCDEQVETGDADKFPSLAEPRYTCNGVISAAIDPQTAIEGLLSAMAGTAVWAGGEWLIRAGAYRTPVEALTDNDVREEGIRLQTKVTRQENFNGVRGKFVSPTNDWQPDDFPAYQSAVYVSEDQGVESWRDIELPFTISPYTAQRLAKIELETTRRQQTAFLSGKLASYRALTGETVTFEYDRWGFAAKPFEVKQVSLALEGNALLPELILRETSPLVFDWAASEEQIYAAAPRTTLPSAFDVPPPENVSLTDELYITRDGSQAKARLVIEWTAAQSAFVTEYQVETRRTIDQNGDATLDDWETLGSTENLFLTREDIGAGTWEARVRSRTALGVTSDWITVTRSLQGLQALPGPILGLSLQSAGGVGILEWQQSTDLDVLVGGEIVIRHSKSVTPSWSNSVSMKTVSGNQATTGVPFKPGTYLVRARDSSGNFGDIATVETKGVQAVPFANVNTLSEHPTWTGVKTNCEIIGSDLTLTDFGNLVLAPDDFTDPLWTKTNVTIQQNSGSATTHVATDQSLTPLTDESGNELEIFFNDGSVLSDSIIETTDNGEHSVEYPFTVVVEGTTYVFEVEAQAQGRTVFAIDAPDAIFGTGSHAEFDLSNGTVSVAAGTRIINAPAPIDLGNGVFRCRVELEALISGAANINISLRDGAGAASYTGDGTSGIAVDSVTVIPLESAGVGLYEFDAGFDFGVVRRLRLRSVIDVAGLNLGSTIDDRIDPIDDWFDFDDTEGAEIDVNVDVRTTDDDPLASPVWTPWGRLDSSEIEFRAAEFRARLSTSNANWNLLLSELSVEADEVV